MLKDRKRERLDHDVRSPKSASGVEWRAIEDARPETFINKMLRSLNQLKS